MGDDDEIHCDGGENGYGTCADRGKEVVSKPFDHTNHRKQIITTTTTTNNWYRTTLATRSSSFVVLFIVVVIGCVIVQNLQLLSLSSSSSSSSLLLSSSTATATVGTTSSIGSFDDTTTTTDTTVAATAATATTNNAVTGMNKKELFSSGSDSLVTAPSFTDRVIDFVAPSVYNNCGGNNPCPDPMCCSDWGYCGNGPEYCDASSCKSSNYYFSFVYPHLGQKWVGGICGVYYYQNKASMELEVKYIQQYDPDNTYKVVTGVRCQDRNYPTLYGEDVPDHYNSDNGSCCYEKWYTKPK